MRQWFSTALETVATFWRIERVDGVCLGFVSHDRDLTFNGLLHRAAPGMVPSAVRLSGSLEPDSAEITGALTHDTIRTADLESGRYDGARIVTGVVDWQTLENEAIYSGTIGAVGREGSSFSAELDSLKMALTSDLVPRTAPTCRAEFCGPGCALPASRFTHEGKLAEVSADHQAIRISCPVTHDKLIGGTLRWLDGDDAGRVLRIEAVMDGWLYPERLVDGSLTPGAHVIVREGCDHRLETCAKRFGNAANFQGEPFLPGNDLLARYPSAQS